MNEFIEKLYENIIKSTDSCDDAIKVLKKLKEIFYVLELEEVRLYLIFQAKSLKRKTDVLQKE